MATSNQTSSNGSSLLQWKTRTFNSQQTILNEMPRCLTNSTNINIPPPSFCAGCGRNSATTWVSLAFADRESTPWCYAALPSSAANKSTLRSRNRSKFPIYCEATARYRYHVRSPSLQALTDLTLLLLFCCSRATNPKNIQSSAVVFNNPCPV